jgi:hypothetical protein
MSEIPRPNSLECQHTLKRMKDRKVKMGPVQRWVAVLGKRGQIW